MVRQGDSIIIKRRDFSGILDKKVDQVQEQVPHAAEVAPKEHFDSNYFMRFESRESTFHGIFEALEDDNISRVVLYGIGGVGKTTLAKRVGQRAKELNIFNLVLFIVAPNGIAPHVKTVQDDIADQLGLNLEEEADVGARRRRISQRLTNEEHLLMILDDVRHSLNLQEIGILDDGSCLSGKVLLTTSYQNVAYSRGCQRSFHLFLLTDEEAWKLLCKHASIGDGSHNVLIQEVSVMAAKHCNGSPLACSVIGSALRGKTIGQVRELLHELGSSVDEDLIWADNDSSKSLYKSIVVCYNALSNHVAKTIFLLCGLIPKHNEILIVEICFYALLLGQYSLDEINAAINTLKDSCFLMHPDKSEGLVIMHDMVQNVAFRMAHTKSLGYGERTYCYAEGLAYNFECFQWQKELFRILPHLNDLCEHPSSSTSNATFYDDGEAHETQAVQLHRCPKAATIHKPSGKMVDFYGGLCKVDKSFLPLLKEACAMRPQLIESQRRHSEIVRARAFDCLGLMLFMLHNVRKRDWVYHKDELEMFWEQLMAFKFDLEWLRPTVEGVLSSADIARIQALREEERYWGEEAVKLREQLKIVENKAALFRTEIALTESMLDDSAIAQVFNVRVVSKIITRSLKKFFLKHKFLLLRNLVSSK